MSPPAVPTAYIELADEELSDENSIQQHLGNSSESDTLDSDGSRKRRKVMPEEKMRTSVLSAPSRITRRKIEPTLISNQASLSKTLVSTDPTTTFASLGVKPWLVRSLGSMAINQPTGIQKGCIPEILNGKDCIGGSRTGSGKTVAFAVPILQKWAEDPIGVFALVLTPTRELALQIYEQFKAISSPQQLKIVLITGGTDMRPQATALSQRPHIVIATPGRLADHIQTSGEDTICGLRRVQMVVLDEADRLLANGSVGCMLPDVDVCLSILPSPALRQTLLFTATITPEVRALKELPRTPDKPPVYICEVDTQKLVTPPTLKQMYLLIPVTHREHYLHVFLLTNLNISKSVIIFCNRTTTADYLTHLLRHLEHRVTALHSKLPQRQRTENLSRFRASAARILVATDVASRGLDIPEVGLVINYDIPRDPDAYIHRVGRTARAGRKGEAVTIVGQRDVQLVQAIEARIGKKMELWEEEGVNLETRVIRDTLKLVSEKKREAALEIEEGKEVGGKRKRGLQKLLTR
ncbi:ATP-dependent RNA helicase [Podosphaera aphanis]|nr:ATP-dependent RNA helicase [Podosphaera aphanis]